MGVRKVVITLGIACSLTIVLVFSIWLNAVLKERSLAESLANQHTRQAALETILADRGRKIPLLLSWTRHPPSHVYLGGLYEGMANAFAESKTTEAIPFLIEHISMKSSGGSFAPWLKRPGAIEQQLPCIGALVQIGPEASRFLIRRTLKGMDGEDRISAIFVVGRIRGVPEAKAFLDEALGQANQERLWAEEGIGFLESGR